MPENGFITFLSSIVDIGELEVMGFFKDSYEHMYTSIIYFIIISDHKDRRVAEITYHCVYNIVSIHNSIIITIGHLKITQSTSLY